MKIDKVMMAVAAVALAMSANATMQYGYEWGSDSNGAYVTKTAADADALSFTVVSYTSNSGRGDASMESLMEYSVVGTTTKTTTEKVQVGNGRNKRWEYQEKTETVEAEKASGGMGTDLANGLDTFSLDGLAVGDKVYFQCVGAHPSTVSYDEATDTYVVGHDQAFSYGTESHSMTITFASAAEEEESAPSGQPLPGVLAVLALAGSMTQLKRVKKLVRA